MNGAVESTAWVVRAQRMRASGLGLLFLAGLSWAYLAMLMFTPFESAEYSNHCDAPAFRDHVYEDCEEERPWTTMTGILAASVPLGMLGMGLYTSGTTTLRVREYVSEVMVADKASSAQPAGSGGPDGTGEGDGSGSTKDT
ncbi:hypothetical protein HUT19_26555 [Streptomyces sp. NA02950]|uniref:hypothetical protein n=1 Tax=Streptomyces sp. NA02950 TaxID=2742137 RepID=UPI0015929D0C|nr:hypothetical protein [Streptomyces sp. NA02950]QKV94867.1 hypothetical protein HUT19_26555 [Streptomyces sp. NA02950]